MKPLVIGYIILSTVDMAQYFASFKAGFEMQLSIADQHILTTFLKDGHFMRHLRKMRMAYHERQLMLVRAIEKDMNGKTSVMVQDAGMHLIGWLNKTDDDSEISKLPL
jgi:GntR family transcriptional regulator / MocR family aminotransferase